MTYVKPMGRYYAVMIESNGLLGDYAIRKCRSEAVALEFSRKTNRKLQQYAKRVEKKSVQ